jgi:hypothetical protein
MEDLAPRKSPRIKTSISSSDIAIVGAGIAGLTCAKRLSDNGYTVKVFDKGRGPGGRVATRRVHRFSFDHGAQYFTATGREFLNCIDIGRATGAIASWDGTITTFSNDTREPVNDRRQRWVGVPGMSAWMRHVSAGLDVCPRRKIVEITQCAGKWRLFANDGSLVGEADLVIVAVPALQAVPLLACSPDLADEAVRASYQPCWAVLLGFEEPLSVSFDAAFIGDCSLAWVCRDSSKPGRGGGEAWVLHATPSWSRDHLEADPPAVLEDILRTFTRVVGGKVPDPAFSAAHRWRYARVDTPTEQSCLYDSEQKIGACGDWCVGGKIEAAFESGWEMAQRVIDDCITKFDADTRN